MAGNVWEWTASRNVSFDEAEDQFRDDSSQVVERIVRGGSWYTEEPGAFECAFRGFDYPMNVYFDLGFRVLLGPANPTYWHDRA
jgi:formylglycine-generating enzyme required for sulfatase activity